MRKEFVTTQKEESAIMVPARAGVRAMPQCDSTPAAKGMPMVL